MKNLVLVLGLTAALSGCAREEATSPPPDAETSKPSAAAGTEVPGADSPKGPPASDTAAAPAPAADPIEPTAPAFREVTIPAGTSLALTLQTDVASDTSNVEDQVRATLRKAITVEGMAALPQGTTFIGHVTDAARSAKVKGRARIAFRFTRADLPGEGGQLTVRTGTVSRVAEATKKRDAATIGGGAVGGAIIGGIIGGGDGAAKGAAIGGGAGTAAVLATRGKEVRLPAGTPLSVKLTAPVTVRVYLN